MKKVVKVIIACVLGVIIYFIVSFTFDKLSNNLAPKENSTALKTNVQKPYSGDVVLTTESKPTQPFVNGQVNQAFINRFNNAVTLNSKTGQFVINKNALPVNTTTVELSALEKMVAQSNSTLKQVIASTPKANMVQSGNSVVVAQKSEIAQEVAKNKQIITTATYHEGKTYIVFHWTYARVYLSKTVANNILKGGVAGISILGVVLTQGRLAKALSVAGIIGSTWMPSVKGGVIGNFNYSTHAFDFRGFQ